MHARTHAHTHYICTQWFASIYLLSPSHTHTHRHTHTHTLQIHPLLVTDGKEEKQQINICRRDKVGFLQSSFKWIPNRERKRVPEKRSLPEGPSSEHRRVDRARRVEIKQLWEAWMSCATDNVEAGKSYVALNPAAARKPVQIRD